MDSGQMKKYSIYALGEIILVVIGILIALQINNWNETEKAKAKEVESLKNLVQDLKFDLISFERNKQTITDIAKSYHQLYEIGVKNIDTIKINTPNNIRRLPYYNPIITDKNPLTIGVISNETIKQEILNYFRAMVDMNDSYGEFEYVIQRRLRIFLSDKQVHDLPGWFENKDMRYKSGIYKNFIKAEDLVKLSKTPEFQQLLLEASIKAEESLMALNALMEQNKKLIASIENSLPEK